MNTYATAQAVDPPGGVNLTIYRGDERVRVQLTPLAALNLSRDLIECATLAMADRRREGKEPI